VTHAVIGASPLACKAHQMMSFLHRSNRALAARAIRSARRALVGAESGGVVVTDVLHYGAVDIDPRHLVVWILLSGKPDDDLPAWLTVTPEPPADVRAEGVDYDWLLGLRQVVVRELAGRQWPNADSVEVAVDSEHRVRTNGGWHYFQ